LKFLYFAYGSNLDMAQMRTRCPESRFYNLGILNDYELIFCGHSKKRKGGVASVRECAGSFVEGVLYQITSSDLHSLDRSEGFPISYIRKPMTIQIDPHQTVRALVYVKENAELSDPHPDYLGIISEAYTRFNFNTMNLVLSLK